MRLIVEYDARVTGDTGTTVTFADYATADRAIEFMTTMLKLDADTAAQVGAWLASAKVGDGLIVDVAGLNDAFVFVSDPAAGRLSSLASKVVTVLEEKTAEKIGPKKPEPKKKAKK